MPENNFHNVIVNSSSTGSVQAYLPENVTISVASDWQAPFADKGEGALTNLLGMAGLSIKTKALTAQRWVGSSPIEISLPLILTAETDPQADVMDKIRSLMKLVVPGVNGQFFVPPGPNFINYINNINDPTVNTVKQMAAQSEVLQTAVGAVNSTDVGKLLMKEMEEQSRAQGETIDIYLGQFLYFPQVVVLSVVPTLYTQMLHHSGNPRRADVEFTFRMYTTSTKGDIDRIFRVNDMRNNVFDVNSVKGTLTKKIGDKAKSALGNLF